MTTPKRHYHVGYNMPGYLPDMDPYVVGTISDARNAVASEIEYLNDWCGVDGHNHGPYTRHGTLDDMYLQPRRCAGGGAEIHVWRSDACYCAEGSHEMTCDRDSHYDCNDD